MPDYRKAFPSKYIKADDFVGKRIRAKIDHVEWEEIEGEEKPFLYFTNSKQGMYCNGTNCATLETMSGSRDTDNWGGLEIVITTEEITKGKLKGKNMFVIEIPQHLKPKKQDVSFSDNVPLPDDDSIPF